MMKKFLIALLLISVTCSKLVVHFSGNPLDGAVDATLNGPVLILEGGAEDVFDDLQFSIDKIRGCTNCNVAIDIVIPRKYDTEEYNSYFMQFRGVNSVTTLVVDKREDSYRSEVDLALSKAEMVFYGGGDQCDHVSHFKDTPVEWHTQRIYQRGGAIGGVSAGTAIQGQYVYDACESNAVTSDQALTNPFDKSMSFTYNFFNWPFLNNVFVDQHFVQRNRMGRLVAFLGRQIADNVTNFVWGVGINAETSLHIDDNGLATIYYNNGTTGPAPIPPASQNPVVYFLYLDHACEVVVDKTRLTCTNIKVWKRTGGQTFNLKNRPIKNPDYTLSVVDGVLSSTSGSVY